MVAHLYSNVIFPFCWLFNVLLYTSSGYFVGVW